jgi:hypothetical protein
MSWDHHPTIWDLRYQHGFADWTDEEVRAHYPITAGEEEVPDWLAIHRRDHERGETHLSDVEEEVTPPA